ncbi:hypothetical protein GCM10017673_03600 [Streptosporangium violaceochromogenes]|nr:hypothetical protein GCM10017673_03600 [Streptosporangium violaceochromogenes]
MEAANLVLAVISAAATVAGTYFAWVSAWPALKRRYDRARRAVPEGGPVSGPAPGPVSGEKSGRENGRPAAKYDVFVSYSPADAALVTPLAERLERRGVRVAYDKVVVGPASIVLHEIEKAIRDSAHGLLVLSPGSLSSGPVRNEYYALLNRSMRDERLLIPVLAKGVDESELPEFVKIRFCGDLRDPSEELLDRRADEIARALRKRA